MAKKKSILDITPNGILAYRSYMLHCVATRGVTSDSSTPLKGTLPDVQRDSGVLAGGGLLRQYFSRQTQSHVRRAFMN